jgi:3-hydroxyisobutyrate dehydrogenase-like beta-hydroxyacid dehydrogenase
VSVGFIGLGSIGKPMARQLLKLDEPVWVYDIAEAPLAELAGVGARRAASPGELARECRVIGVCVRDNNDVEQSLYGDAGLLANAAVDTVIAIHSTVTVKGLRRWAHDAQTRGLHLIDAPITGGQAGAEAGTLCYMLGGDAAILDRCEPVFATSGGKQIRAGAVGAGIALKLCNNLMTYSAFAAIDEGARLANAIGLSVDMLIEVGKSNGVVTPQMIAFLRNRQRVLSAWDADGAGKAFTAFAALGRKDLAAALESADQLGVKLPATERVYEIIERVMLGQN